MKKQNLNNKLAFNKLAVTELNDNALYDVNGGLTPVTISSLPCIRIASAVIGSLVAWAID